MSAYLCTLSSWDDPSVTELRFFFSPKDNWIFLTIQTNRHPIFTGTRKPRPLFIFYYFIFLQMNLFPSFKPCLYVCVPVDSVSLR